MEESDGSRPCSSQTGESVAKKQKKEVTATEEGNDDDEEFIPKNVGETTSQQEEFTGKCCFEVRRWKRGDYTLITDDNDEIRTRALDMMVFFNCSSWSLECGGNVSYIARNEDDEVFNLFN